MTFANERFIPLHMMFVKMRPDAPTSDPLIISPLFIKTNPVAAAATPEYEFNNEITTGISAPPIGIVRVIPRIAANATTPRKYSIKFSTDNTIPAPAVKRESANNALRICWPLKTIG